MHLLMFEEKRGVNSFMLNFICHLYEVKSEAFTFQVFCVAYKCPLFAEWILHMWF